MEAKKFKIGEVVRRVLNLQKVQVVDIQEDIEEPENVIFQCVDEKGEYRWYMGVELEELNPSKNVPYSTL